jgi:hypothetical protein
MNFPRRLDGFCLASWASDELGQRVEKLTLTSNPLGRERAEQGSPGPV